METKIEEGLLQRYKVENFGDIVKCFATLHSNIDVTFSQVRSRPEENERAGG